MGLCAKRCEGRRRMHPHPFPSTSISEEEINITFTPKQARLHYVPDKIVQVFEIKNYHLYKGLPFHFTTCMPFEFFTILMCSVLEK